MHFLINHNLSSTNSNLLGSSNFKVDFPSHHALNPSLDDDDSPAIKNYSFACIERCHACQFSSRLPSKAQPLCYPKVIIITSAFPLCLKGGNKSILLPCGALDKIQLALNIYNIIQHGRITSLMSPPSHPTLTSHLLTNRLPSSFTSPFMEKQVLTLKNPCANCLAYTFSPSPIPTLNHAIV